MSKERVVELPTTSPIWTNMSTPRTPISPKRRNKMPRLMRAGNREDYPVEFLDTVERIDVICQSLKRLERLGKVSSRDAQRRQKIFCKASEMFKDYGDQLLSSTSAAIFQQASTKFFEIGDLFVKEADVLQQKYTAAIREFNKTEMKTLKRSFKDLAKARRRLNKARKKANNDVDENTKAALDEAQKNHDECFAAAREALLNFMKSTAFFGEAANAYLVAETDLCEKIHFELSSLGVVATYTAKSDY
ncbi:unnamed protein product [Cylicocyclus nassatus]|uniref:BAR domain-containing protein n=1 Tax=Cylicocyclus nassatus TaxID=53992 RepID=A0AA36MAL1_CYLNA|nr:unnamed protein product [Cylicocyclus nassatus]